MPADLPQELDEEFRGELCIRSFEFCRQRHSHLLRSVNDSWSDGLAERAECCTGGDNVQRPRWHRLGLDSDPVLRTTWLIEGEHSVESPSRGVTLGEWLAQIPHLPQCGDEGGVAVLLVVHRSRRNPWRHHDRWDPVAGAVEGEAEFTRWGGRVGGRNGSGRNVVIGATRLVPADQQGGVPDIGARRSGHGPVGVVDARAEGTPRRASTKAGRIRCPSLHR